MNLKSGLYIVSTPIGNMEDISFRAVETLQNSHIIFCEDTRVTVKLLTKYNINKKLLIYNDQATEKNRIKIAKLIDEGNIISLVSDAGTPLISDPGYKLVEYLKERNYHVDIIPGPCSVIAALTLSSMPTDQFYFIGFLPKTRERVKKSFEKLKDVPATLIFFETARNLVENLQIAYDVYGDREASIVREITKLYQESNRSSISNLIKKYSEKAPKGEIVVLIAGIKNYNIDIENIEEEIKSLIKQNLSAKDIINIIILNHPQYKKSQIYKEITAIKELKK
jgi:16S rRNA (cytidine1402-2'-O)-methyltransferase